MTSIDTATLYDETLRGEPLERVVSRAQLNTGTSLWTLGDWPVIVPPSILRPAPEMLRIVSHLKEWTGWSARQLAKVFNTSHTTVLGVESGRPIVNGRSGDLRRRLTEIHDLVERTYLLANRDPDMVKRLLETAPPGRRSTIQAIQAIQSGEPARAYLAVIDALRPRTPGLLVGNRPRQNGATAPLYD